MKEDQVVTYRFFMVDIPVLQNRKTVILITVIQSLNFEFCPSDFSLGSCMLGELEFFPSTIPLDSILPIQLSDTTEAMAENAITTTSTDFLGDTGASHHIVHKREYFSELFPLPGALKIHQVEGTVIVTHWGMILLQVDSAPGKEPLRVTNALYIDSMQFNILSMQKLRSAGFIPVYNEVPSKVVIMKLLPHGGL